MLGLLPAGGGTQRFIERTGLVAGLPMLLTGKRVRAKKAKRMGLVDALTTPGGIVETAAKAALAMADGKLKRPRRKKTLLDRLSSFPPVRAKILQRGGETGRAQNPRALPGAAGDPRLRRNRAQEGPARGARSRVVLLRQARHRDGEPQSGAALPRHEQRQEAGRRPGAETGRSARGARCGIHGRRGGVGLPGEVPGGAQGHLGRGARRRDPNHREGTDKPGALGRHHPARGRPAAIRAAGRPPTMPIWPAPTSSSRRSSRISISNGGWSPRSRSRSHPTRSSPPTPRRCPSPGSPRAPGTPSGSSGCTTSRRCPRCRCSRSSSPRPPPTGRRPRPRRFGIAQGKTCIVVKDGPGFYTTRILAPYLNEAVVLLEEGAKIEDLDRVMKDFGYPVGPVALMDEVGIDVGAHVAADLGAAFAERGLGSSDALPKMYEAGFEGRKNGKGFYLYPKKKKKGPKPVNTEVYRFFGGPDRRNGRGRRDPRPDGAAHGQRGGPLSRRGGHRHRPRTAISGRSSGSVFRRSAVGRSDTSITRAPPPSSNGWRAGPTPRSPFRAAGGLGTRIESVGSFIRRDAC